MKLFKSYIRCSHYLLSIVLSILNNFHNFIILFILQREKEKKKEREREFQHQYWSSFDQAQVEVVF